MGSRTTKHFLWIVLAILFAFNLAACSERIAPGGELDVEEEGTVEPPPVDVAPTDEAGGANVNDNTGGTDANTNDNAAGGAANTNANDNASGGETEDEGAEAGQVQLQGAEGMTLGEAAANLNADANIGMFMSALNTALSGRMVGNVDLEGAEFVLFIPSNDVLATMDMNDLNVATMDAVTAQAFFGCYIAEGAMSQDEMAEAGTIATLSGDVITVDGEAGDLTLNGNVRIVQELRVSNGVIYVVDGLLCQPGDR